MQYWNQMFQQLVSWLWATERRLTIYASRLLNYWVLSFSLSLECMRWSRQNKKSVWTATWHSDSAQTPGKTHLVCWDVVPCWQWHWRQIQIQLTEALQLKKLAQLSLLFAKWYLETSKGKKEKYIFPFFKRNNFGETFVQTSAKWRLATAQPPSSLCRRLARLAERSTAGV